MKMGIALSRGARAPAEQMFRALVKNALLNLAPPGDAPLPPGKLAHLKVLAPYLGEMGTEIRTHIALCEPWLRAGWKALTRRPAFYPDGAALDVPEFYAAADAIMAKYEAKGAYGGPYIPPEEFGEIAFAHQLDGRKGSITITLDDTLKVMAQAMVEIELRKLFLEWFHYPGRPVSFAERAALSFDTTAFNSHFYNCAVALRPSFLPPAFANPPEATPPHVGVQMRRLANMPLEPRNSDAAWMMKTAKEIAAHLGLKVLVYGHPAGCVLPDGEKTSWDAARPAGHLGRELGYLKSCKLMLAPDSGWADLMAWLEIPTMLEMSYYAGGFSYLRAGFTPRLRVFDRSRPAGEQAEELLAAPAPVFPDDETPADGIDPRLFPWEP
jgi:hypothetical protein